MRVKRFFLNKFSVTLTVFISALVSGCSSNNTVNSQGASSASAQKSSSEKKASSAKEFIHIHPGNPCTQLSEHSHPFESKEHEHGVDCDDAKKHVTNAHIHPATEKTRIYRHVHPNGAAKHSHNR